MRSISHLFDLASSILARTAIIDPACHYLIVFSQSRPAGHKVLLHNDNMDNVSAMSVS